ncbi:hypothetical protein E1287_01520 [Actinomadura sp. KC06]|uniref:hypothetical protein n=1 Tax=Actinomadura sp. KC06 TaxID=2530369 RepID=UPI00104814EC|nr:hypothetical protein [Actinomadura sp. KC06]TDD40223.1 hypothetical protein E1287_01520 [Actinomadura sp. KC06]
MFDRDAYRRDVLDAARARGNAPPADLLARYALPGEARDRDQDGRQVAARLAEVVAYWRTLRQQKKTYAKLIDALLIEHAGLDRAGLLTRDGLTEETRRRVDEATEWLTRQAGTLAETTTGINRAAFDVLLNGAGGACSDARVRKILADRGVRVVETAWELPDTAPPAYRTLSAGLRQLRLRLSAEAVVGADAVARGFRLRDGFRLVTASPAGPAGPLTAQMIAAAVERSAGRARDEGKAALDGVLSALAEAAREPGRLDDLLLWEVMEVLRPGAEAGLAAKVLAGQAADLGLVRGEAEELAMAMAARGGRPGGVAGQVEEALRDGRLREAERLLPGLPADAPPELRAEVEEAARRVAGWLAEAARERTAGRTEAAAELLDRAARTAADDDGIAERLRALPPPPPGDVRVGAERGRVTIAWTPGPARVGPVRYRVVRSAGAPASGAAAGTPVGETDANELHDPDPPAAQELHYSVFAGRAEGIWSAPAAGRPVTLLPEVEEPSVVASPGEVAVSWRLPKGATGAVATRLGDGGADRRLARVDRSGFVDADVRPGRTYRYRVQASYERSDGTRVLSKGVVVTGLPESPPSAVSDLSVELPAAGRQAATISWTAPSGGRVMIRTSDAPPPWPPGTLLAADDVERYGREVRGAAVPASGGRMTLRTPVDGVTSAHFVAVTVGAGQALVGPSAVLVTVEPVRELDVRRVGDTAVLSWIWPDGARYAEVVWAPADLAGSALGDPDAWTAASVSECRRRAYEDDGCRLDVGPGAALVAVRTLARDENKGGAVRSRPVLGSVPAREAEVRYRFRAARRRRRGAAVLELTADQRTRLPPLVVVHRAGDVLPLRPEQGDVIHEIPARDLDPETPLTLRFEIPGGARRFRLACFPAPGAASGGTGAVTLRRDPRSW